MVDGQDQSGVVNGQLSQPLRVRVTAVSGQPVAGAAVAFQVMSGAGAVAADTVLASATGEAQTTWRLGKSVADSQRVRASVHATDGTVLAVDFRAQAMAGPPATIGVTPSSSAGELGDTVVLAATAVDSFGNPVALSPIVWTSSDTFVVRVATGSNEAQGLAREIGVGSAVVRATNGAIGGQSTLTVSPGAVSSVVVTPSLPHAPDAPDYKVAFPCNVYGVTAAARNRHGYVVSGYTFTWTSSNPDVAAVTSTGATSAQMWTRGAGTVIVSASTSDVTGSATVSIGSGLQPCELTVFVGDSAQVAFGNSGSGSTPCVYYYQPVWQAGDAAVASVQPKPGVPYQAWVRGVSPGTATVSGYCTNALSMDISGTIRVTVASPP